MSTEGEGVPRRRYGVSVPFHDVPMADHPAMFKRLADIGYTDIWAGESNGIDAFTPLAMAAVAAPSMMLGTAVVPVFTRGPALLAMQAATLSELAPGRFSLGIGSSSDIIVENWNSRSFVDPYKRVRDTVRFLKVALAGGRVDLDLDTFSVHGFRLGRTPLQSTPLMVGALRPGMLRLAGREADGAIVNWLSAQDVKIVAAEVAQSKDIVARVFVCPTDDPQLARATARRAIAAYLNVPVYENFHKWLGRDVQLSGMWDAWRAGDRSAALDSIPDSVVDDLVVHGSASRCKEHIAEYFDAGATVVFLDLLPSGLSSQLALEMLAPGI